MTKSISSLRAMVRMACATALLLAGATAALAGDLFQAVKADAAPATAMAAARGTVRTRFVTIDQHYLERTIAPAGKDSADDRVAQLKASTTGRADVTLFPGLTVTLKRADADEAFGGGFTWSGHPAGDPLGSANFVIEDGHVTGAIFYKGKTYEIDPVPGDTSLHRISEVDMTGRQEAEPVLPPKAPAASKSSAIAPAATATTTVTIYIGYSNEVLTEFGSAAAVKRKANLAISLANTAFTNSKMAIRYKLVGIKGVTAYNDASAFDYGTVLDDVTNDNTAFTALKAARVKAKADLLSFFVHRDENCGIAWLGPLDVQYAVSVVTADCISNHSFVHETAHNIGANHDRYVVSDATATTYNYGYVNTTKKIRTVMAYDNKCADLGFTCPRIPYFSTPKVRYRNARIGVAAGFSTSADNARYLQQHVKTVAAFY